MAEDRKTKIIRHKLERALFLISEGNQNLPEAQDLLSSAIDIVKCKHMGPVLVLDHDKAMLELVQEAFNEEGFDVHYAHSVGEVLGLSEKLKGSGRGLRVAILALGADSRQVFSDMFHRLRQDNPNLKIIIASGNLTESSILTSDEAVFWATLNKPYPITELKRLILTALQ